MKQTAATAIAILALTGAAALASPDVETVADTLHPNIHDKVGQGAGANANANPNGNDGAGSNGGQIHGIANVPGQSGADPATGAPGFADQLETVHGGIGARNPNAGR
jgi:hypothetical protein